MSLWWFVIWCDILFCWCLLHHPNYWSWIICCHAEIRLLYLKRGLLSVYLYKPGQRLFEFLFSWDFLQSSHHSELAYQFMICFPCSLACKSSVMEQNLKFNERLCFYVFFILACCLFIFILSLSLFKVFTPRSKGMKYWALKYLAHFVPFTMIALCPIILNWITCFWLLVVS